MIVLDTHAWVWWAARPERLSPAARRALDRTDGVGIASISLWEVAMLVERGRLELDRHLRTWLEQALELPGVELLPLDARVAACSAELPPDFHGDPADRLIAATAIVAGAPLVTKDERLRACRIVETIW